MKFSSAKKLFTGLSQKKEHELPPPVSPSGEVREARKKADKDKKTRENKINLQKLMKHAREEKKKAGLDEKRHGAGEKKKVGLDERHG